MDQVQTVLETERLYLREFSKNDLDLLFQITSDAKVMHHFPSTLTLDETKEFLDKILSYYQQYGHCFWAAFLKTDNSFAGMCGLLHQIIEDTEETEIAYRMTEHTWGNGYATELAKACRDYAFLTLRKERVISLIRPENTASKRVAEKAGLRFIKNVIFHDLIHGLYALENENQKE